MPRRTGYRGPKVPPMWTDEEEELAARDARCSAYAVYAAARKEENEDEPEHGYGWHHQRRRQVDEGDPLHALGRVVKVAGKTLWKRVSNKDVAAAAAAATSIPKSKADSKGQEDSKTGSPTSTNPCLPSTLRPILGSITSNVDDHHGEEEGVIWEEEIGNSFPCDIGQTETIVEGRAVYSRSTNKVGLVSNSPPPSPSVSNSKKMLTKLPSTKKLPPPFKTKQGS